MKVNLLKSKQSVKAIQFSQHCSKTAWQLSCSRRPRVSRARRPRDRQAQDAMQGQAGARNRNKTGFQNSDMFYASESSSYTEVQVLRIKQWRSWMINWLESKEISNVHLLSEVKDRRRINRQMHWKKPKWIFKIHPGKITLEERFRSWHDHLICIPLNAAQRTAP